MMNMIWVLGSKTKWKIKCWDTIWLSAWLEGGMRARVRGEAGASITS